MSDVRLEDLADSEWERLADYVQRVAYLATLQAYWAGGNDKGTRFELSPEIRASDYTMSGFDADTVKRFALSNIGRLPEDDEL